MAKMAKATESILAPIDFSDVTDDLLCFAGKLAAKLGAKLWLIHVTTPQPGFVGYEVSADFVRDSAAAELRHEHRELQRHQNALRDEGIDVTALLVPGTAPEKILAEAKRLKASMMVIGSHGHGALHQLLMGSVCEAVLKKATCPVLVVPSRASCKKKDR